MKNFLKEKVEKLYEEGYGFWDLHYELLGEINVENWPQVAESDDYFDDDDEEKSSTSEEFTEPLDMENFEWVSITDNQLVISCGGDWQNPLTVTMELDGDKLVVVNTEEGYEDGMDSEEFNNILGIEHSEEED